MAGSLFKISIILAQILTGGILTIIYKAQNSVYVYEGPFYKQNFHPYIQTLTMFIGELICLPIFFILKHRYAKQYRQRQVQAVRDGKKLNMNRFLICIPALCDLVTSTLHFIALNFVPTSAYQMMNGGNIITIFILSILFLRQPFSRHQLLGSTLALIGILVVGFANIMETHQQFNQSTIMQIFGYFLLIVSLFTSGFFFIVEQKLMTVYYVEPIQMVGFQGVFGLSCYMIIVLVLNFIPCQFGVDACVYSRQGFGFMENTLSYFDQIFSNWWLLLLTFCWIFCIALYNPLGVTITKHINALARAISDVSQTVLVWAIGITVTFTVGSTYPNYKWEKLQTNVILLQLVGFVFLIFGNMIYNQIMRPTFLKPKIKDESLIQQSPSDTQQKLTSQDASKDLQKRQ